MKPLLGIINVPDISNPQLCVAHARSDPAIWQMAVGQQVTHISFGVGTIKNVEFHKGKIHLDVCFPNDQTPSRAFTSESLSDVKLFHAYVSTEAAAFLRRLVGCPLTGWRFQPRS